MGQRLNISLESAGEVVANAYYHWSAYTGSAAYLVQGICEVWDELKECSLSDAEFACRLLHETGAGFNQEEIDRIRFQKDSRVNTFPLWPSTDRNSGLLSVTQEGIEETERWEEGRVTIYLDSGSIYFDVVFTMTAEEYKNEYEYDNLDHLPRLRRDPTAGLTVENFWKFYAFLEENQGQYEFYIEEGDYVFQLIE